MTKDRARVFVTRRLPNAVEERLRSSYDVALNVSDEPYSRTEIAKALAEYDAIVPTVSDQLDAALLQTPSLRTRIIANVGVGVSNIDVVAARAAGIVTTNTPDVLTDATADLALFLILASTRGAYAAEKMLRDDLWYGFSLTDGLGSSVRDKVLGIIGMGRIGQATARRALNALGMKIVYFNRSSVSGLDFEATRVGSVAALMQISDVVSVHVPGGSDKPIVTADHVALMKPTAYFVNTARGDCVDQEALVDALSSRRIAGAGLDVYLEEPGVPEALLTLSNVTLLPHIGSATIETRTAMGMLATDNLDAFFAGDPLPAEVS